MLRKELEQKKEFKRRYNIYAQLIKKLYDVNPIRKAKNIESEIIDRDLFNLTSGDELIRAISTFNVGHRLSTINRNEAKKYLYSALDQFTDERFINQYGVSFQYIEDALINLQEIYLKEGNYNIFFETNNDYMSYVQRERKEILVPQINEASKNGKVLERLDIFSEMRKK